MTDISMLDGILTGIFLILSLVFLVGSLDDLFIDICHFFGGFKPKRISPETWKEWKSLPERRIAVMIPAWKEADVLESMVRTNLSRIQYSNYRWFIGVYPNDLETLTLAKRLEKEHPSRLTVVVTDRPGPTSKAHCLNCIVRVIDEMTKKKAAWVPDFVAIHDAEDVLHPYSFTAINAQPKGLDFIQIPVFSLPVSASAWVAGTYLDEFTEIHLKELPVRESLRMPIPSAGVGTFFSWRILSILDRRFGYSFNESNLTEDYEISQRIARLGGSQTFLLIRDETGQVVATREYFPDSFGRSVRQKARWTTGIALQTAHEWGKFGNASGPKAWIRNIAAVYGLKRDRKALWANPAAFASWIFLFVILSFGLPISRFQWLNQIVAIDLFLFGIRIFQRARFTAAIYGSTQGLLAVPRVICSNIINGFASIQSILNYMVASRKNGQGKIAWAKTQHKFPDLKELTAMENQLLQVQGKMGKIG